MKKLIIPVGSIEKLPSPSESGSTLFAVIFEEALENGAYILLNGPEMDKYIQEEVPPTPAQQIEEADQNLKFLSDLNARLKKNPISSTELGSTIDFKKNVELAKKAREDALKEKYGQFVTSYEDEYEIPETEEEMLMRRLAEIRGKESAPSEPEILGSLPNIEDSIKSDERLREIVRTGDDVKGNPFNASREEVSKMVKYLVYPFEQTKSGHELLKIQAKKRSIMRVFYGMTASQLSNVQEYMPRELRVNIAMVKMTGLGQDPVSGAGSNYVPPTWSAFIEGERQGDEIYKVVSGNFKFHKPTLKDETPDAQSTGEVVHSMPLIASDLQSNFASFLANMKI